MVTQVKPNTDFGVDGGRKRNLVEMIFRPLVAVYDLVSGPLLTDRACTRRAGIDASVRRSVSVNPYHLTHRR